MANTSALSPGSRVLITGATGLIGSTAIDELAARGDVTIYAAGRNAAGMRARFGALCDAPFFHFVPYDAGLPLSFDLPVDYIIHAATAAHPIAFSTDPVGTMKANLIGTLNLLEYMRGAPGARLIFLSSGEIYGDNPRRESGFLEDELGQIDTMNPRSCYPESKRAAETLIASYCKQYGLHASVARLCHVYGPSIAPANSRADAQFLRNALAGEDITLKSAGAQVRSYCHVEDAADALFVTLTRGKPGHAYNVANRYSTASIRDYAGTLARLAGVKLAFDVPPEVERAGYTNVSRAVLDPSKLEALGWRPKYDLAAGLAQTLARARKML